MKISLNWLGELVDLPDTDTLVARLTVSGFEVEGVERPGKGLDGVVVAEVKSKRPHPNADRLSVTEVSTGDGPLRQVVCGAKNFEVGSRVPLAVPGAVLPGGQKIEAAEVRGERSAGMLCSARELGLAEASDGLLLLSADAPLGTPIAQALGLTDTLLEVNVTPNRPDGLSHVGVAREVAALTGSSVRMPVAELHESAPAAALPIKREDAKGCPRYAARILEGVRIAPSPAWLQARLRACGVRPIHNVVDVTNYVLLELGHPLHAFDLDRLAGGQIVVRRARAGERLKTLDGKTRSLDVEDLVVADRDMPQALAGIMGGGESEVTPATTRILLEAAYFEPRSVRRSSKRHALHTEASHRFERGADPFVIPRALDRAAALIQQLAGGQVRQGRVDSMGKLPAGRVVGLRYSRIEEVLGMAVPPAEVRRILLALGFLLDLDTPEQALFSVPSFRVDVAHEEDLIEEVARIWGYEKVPVRLPQGAATLHTETRAELAEPRLRSALAGAGFDEALNYSFVAPEQLKALGDETRRIALRNPLSVEQSVMRTTLLPGLLQNLSRACRYQAETVRLYELGRVYHVHPEGGRELAPPAHEPLRLAGLLWGRREGRTWSAPDLATDFFDAKGALEAVLDALGIPEGERSWRARHALPLHPRASADLQVGGQTVGSVGELHPRVSQALDLPRGVFVFEVDVVPLYDATRVRPQYAALPQHPASLRDLAVVVSEKVHQAEVQAAIREAGGTWVEAVTLFDQYTGDPIPKGQKNLAFALWYRASDRTLADTEVSQAHERIVKALNDRFGRPAPGSGVAFKEGLQSRQVDRLLRLGWNSPPMTKADIVEGVYEKVGFSKKESAEIVELVFDTLKETLERGDKVKISGFGNFQVRDKKARVGRNPQTGKEIEISARRVLTFRPSQVLKSALNLKKDGEDEAAPQTPAALKRAFGETKLERS